jgi:hypothetical protein
MAKSLLPLRNAFFGIEMVDRQTEKGRNCEKDTDVLYSNDRGEGFFKIETELL